MQGGASQHEYGNTQDHLIQEGDLIVGQSSNIDSENEPFVIIGGCALCDEEGHTVCVGYLDLRDDS